ncbi:TadE/TadG family type IV pilus assembly protein [Vibrio sp. NTOU-M3]|uniref:TadE/TadG family type IV pilus assembly protein n=1 Tax=Vibrio sp. NTOU-M3 TaxID=3234954 RepID=UPI00349F6ED4
MVNISCKQQGVAAVEFLITIPVLLTILIGITELGNALIRYNTLNKLVQNGVRYATSDITGTATFDQIANHDQIKNMVVYGKTTAGDSSLLSNLSTSDVTVTHANGYVTISASHSYSPILDAFPESLNFSFSLNASAVMRTAP